MRRHLVFFVFSQLKPSMFIKTEGLERCIMFERGDGSEMVVGHDLMQPYQLCMERLSSDVFS
jgi:hypothetical protein